MLICCTCYLPPPSITTRPPLSSLSRALLASRINNCLFDHYKITNFIEIMNLSKLNSLMGLFRPIIIVLVLFFCKSNKGVNGATFTFINKCDQTIWPGILGSPILDSTGFELKEGESRTFQAPTGWSGRFWGRSGCNFDGSGQGSCSTGDCGSGEIECNGSGANPPATLAEFTLGSGSQDFYDVSLVDGYNLPMMVNAIGGSGPDSGTCQSTGCIEDLNQKCPKELRVEGGGACRSACEAFGSEEYCCKGEYGSPATCSMGHLQHVLRPCTRNCSNQHAQNRIATRMMMLQVHLHALELIIPSHFVHQVLAKDLPNHRALKLVLGQDPIQFQDQGPGQSQGQEGSQC